MSEPTRPEMHPEDTSPHPTWQGSAPRRGYEFSSSENARIGRAATWAKGVAIILFVQAALALIGFNLISVAIDVAIGLSFWGGAKKLQEVVQTRGNDVTHMMHALDKLSMAFLIRIILVGIVMGFALIGGIVAALMM